MLHILFLIDEIAVRGGTEKSLFGLASALASRGYQITVFSLSEGSYAEEYKGNPLFAYHCLYVKRVYDFSGLRAMVYLRNFISSKKVDIIQTTHTGADLIGPIAAKLAGGNVSVVSSRRDMGFTKSSRHIKAQKKVNAWVDGILANSTAVKEAVIDMEGYPDKKIKVINNGIVLQPYDEVHPQQARRNFCSRYDLDGNFIFIGMAGNLNPIKGQKILLKAMVRIWEAHKNAYCCLAGEGPELEMLTSFCRDKKIDKRVIFLGNISDVPEFMTTLDVYVQSSLSEGFSNAILEAMACRCPVVATKVGGNTDAIKDGQNGFIVESKNSAQLAEKINILLEDQNLRQVIGEKNRRRVRNNFSYEAMICNYEQYYNDLTESIS